MNNSFQAHRHSAAGLALRRSLLDNVLVVLLLLAVTCVAWSGAFVFTDNNPGNPNPVPDPNLIVHPSNYTGAGGTVTVQICIATSSESQAELMIPAANVANTWNRLEPVTGNLKFGADNNVPQSEFDVESVLLHEVGHCLGLNHSNLADESGLVDPDSNYTKAQIGPNDAFNLNAGGDGGIGSADDNRGDDINLHWFRISDNNPFMLGPVVDATTYSRELADLPGNDQFAANADRDIGVLLGIADTEAVMQQGTFNDEAQRELNHDDVATLRLGMAGLDETQGTGDDYQVNMVFGGVADDCDITIEMTGSSSGFCSAGGTNIPPGNTHFSLTEAMITLGSATNVPWFFNAVSSSDILFEDGFEAN